MSVRDLSNLLFAGKICAKFVPRVLRENQKERCCYDRKIRKKDVVNLVLTVLETLVTCDESWLRCYDSEFPVEACWLSQTQEGQTEQIPFFFHWTDSQQGILCWGFKGDQEEIPSEEAITHQIGSVAFPPGHCSNPQLHPCHRLFDQDEHQNSTSPPYHPDFASCDFWLFPKLSERLRVSRYETIEEIKVTVTKVIDTLIHEDFRGTFQSCWTGTTSALLPEELTSKGTRVSCVYCQ